MKADTKPGFYVLHGENPTSAFRRVRKHYDVALVHRDGMGPVLYDGMAVSGEVETARAAMRAKQEAMKGRLVIVATDNSKLVGGLRMLDAKQVTSQELHDMLDRMGIAR